MVAPEDHGLASDLAARTGELLLKVRMHYSSQPPSLMRTEGDRQAHEFIVQTLSRERPHDAVLSEEGVDDASRLAAERVWIVDPLDGTWEFGEADRVDWAVHIALWESGALVAGAVALPAQNRVFSTAQPPGPPTEFHAHPRVVVSRSRPPTFAAEVASRVGGTLVQLGSAGAKAMAVVTDAADAYLHAGGQHEWDVAAPVAVARAAGLHASRIDGSDFAFNQPDPHLADLLICRTGLADQMLAAIADVAVG